MNENTFELTVKDYKKRNMYELAHFNQSINQSINHINNQYQIQFFWGGWMIYRFRVFAIDNDYLNFVDVSLNEALIQPILLITNPPVMMNEWINWYFNHPIHYWRWKIIYHHYHSRSIQFTFRILNSIHLSKTSKHLIKHALFMFLSMTLQPPATST